MNIHCLLLIAMTLLPAAVIGQKRDSVMFGVASYYHNKFNGRKTSNGEIFRNDSLTAAHKNLPFGTRVRVTNLNNDSSVIVRINDRLPQSSTRSIDLSQAAARRLDMIRSGIVKARIEILPYDVLKVSPEFAAYLLNEKGVKITPDIIRQLKSARWNLSYITDSLNGKANHSPAHYKIMLHYGDSIYITGKYGASGKYNVIDSLLIMHHEIKKDNSDRFDSQLAFSGPFVIYKLDSTMLVLGKPLSSDRKWHRNYHFYREDMPAKIEQFIEQKKMIEARHDSLLIQLEASQAAAYKLNADSVYKSYPLGITREPVITVAGCRVETVVNKQPDKVNVYTKKSWDWGGVFYFKNDISTSQDIFEKETGIK